MLVIVCLSRDSITKEGYVQKEIKLALDVADEKPEGTIFIIPLRLEECAVPQRLSKWQWIDYFREGGFEKLRSGLRASITDRAKVSEGPVALQAPLLQSKTFTILELYNGVKPTVTLRHHGDPVTYHVDGRIVRLVDASMNMHSAPFRCQLIVSGRRGEWDALLQDGDWANIILGSLEDVFPPSAPGMTAIQSWTPVGKVLVIRRGKMGEHVQVPDAGAVVELTVTARPKHSEPIRPRQFQIVREGDTATVTELVTHAAD